MRRDNIFSILARLKSKPICKAFRYGHFTLHFAGEFEFKKNASHVKHHEGEFLLVLLVSVKLLKYGMSRLNPHVRIFFVTGHYGA